jgi:hypothetical protein
MHLMPNISDVKLFLIEISYIPDEQITIPIKSKNLLQYQSSRKSFECSYDTSTLENNMAQHRIQKHTIWFKIFLVCSCKQ